jgi:hypothetical protein
MKNPYPDSRQVEQITRLSCVANGSVSPATRRYCGSFGLNRLMWRNTMMWIVTDCWFLSISAIRLQNSSLASENSLLVQAPTETARINDLL